jgi:hypothetical protein
MKLEKSCQKRSLSSVFFFSLTLQPPWALASAFNFMIILQTVGLLVRVISSSQGLYLNTGQHKHRINTYTHQTSMPCVGFEPMITASELAKTFHALDCSATVIGSNTTIKVLGTSEVGATMVPLNITWLTSDAKYMKSGGMRFSQ